MNVPENNRLFVARMNDLARQAECGIVCYSDFLTPAERSQLISLCKLSSFCNIAYDGGYAEAERVRARFSPLDFDYETETPITTVEITCRIGELNHRDVLGSVLGLGLSRGKIGDIIVSGSKAIIICDREIASYIINNLEKVGRLSVKASYGKIQNISITEKKKIVASVMSLRLDAIVSEGFSISRTKAAELIRIGACFVNWINIDSPSHQLKKGDVITIRGKGRITLSEIGGQSRKGRTFIEILV